MAVTLSQYITQCRRLLHDANGNFYTTDELTDYVNDARNRLVRDTGCLRTLQTSATVTNQEVYSFSSLPQGTQTMDIININLYWGNSRLPLLYRPWTDFNAQLRYWQNFTGRPVAYSMYGPQAFYLGPVPDQVYTMELDTVIEPTPLVQQNEVDTIPDIWTQPVAYYASHTAKFKEQSYGEAEIFKQQYIKNVQALLVGSYTRRLPTAYSQAY
jgi:hypothetical protein